jgi:hypothetical protein
MLIHLVRSACVVALLALGMNSTAAAQIVNGYDGTPTREEIAEALAMLAQPEKGPITDGFLAENASAGVFEYGPVVAERAARTYEPGIVSDEVIDNRNAFNDVNGADESGQHAELDAHLDDDPWMPPIIEDRDNV